MRLSSCKSVLWQVKGQVKGCDLVCVCVFVCVCVRARARVSRLDEKILEVQKTKRYETHEELNSLVSEEIEK